MFSLKILGGAALGEDAQPVTGGAVRRHPLALLAIAENLSFRSAPVATHTHTSSLADHEFTL